MDQNIPRKIIFEYLNPIFGPENFNFLSKFFIENLNDWFEKKNSFPFEMSITILIHLIYLIYAFIKILIRHEQGPIHTYDSSKGVSDYSLSREP